MVIVIGGPPHSGKSTFVDALMKNLPKDRAILIRGCPDGENDNSNNIDQEMIQIRRRKGSFSQSFIENVNNQIEKQKKRKDIVIVDVGGKLESDENTSIMQHCDSCIIVSGDSELRAKWHKKFLDNNLTPLAILNSIYIPFKKKYCDYEAKGNQTGEEFFSDLTNKYDRIVSNKMNIYGNIYGLNRGISKRDSIIVKEVAKDIIEKTKDKEKNDKPATERLEKETVYLNEKILNDIVLSVMNNKSKDKKSQEEKKDELIKWDEKTIKTLIDWLDKKDFSEKTILLENINPELLGILTKGLQRANTRNIEVYDKKTDKFVPISNLEKKKNISQSNNLQFNMVENDNAIVMDVIPNDKFSSKDAYNCKLPDVDKGKDLYICADEVPDYMIAALVNNYENNRIYLYSLGNSYFTCIDSKENKDEINKAISGPDGIRTRTFLEDMKKNSKSLAVINKKNNIFTRFFEKIFNKKKQNTYLENSVEHTYIDKDARKMLLEDMINRENSNKKYGDESGNSIQNIKTDSGKKDINDKTNNVKQGGADYSIGANVDMNGRVINNTYTTKKEIESVKNISEK